MRTTTLFVMAGISLTATGQMDSLSLIHGSSITANELQEHLSVLASDEFEGRETGFEGQKKAAAYIVEHFKQIGIPAIKGKEGLLENGYEQTFQLRLKRPGGLAVVQGGKRFEFLEDILYFNKEIEAGKSFNELLFAGYGMKSLGHNDMEGVSCQGCAMLMLDGVAERKKAVPKDPDSGKQGMQLMGVKSRAAAESGAEVLYLVSDRLSKMRGQFASFLQSSRMSLMEENTTAEEKENKVQTILISEEMADRFLRKGGTSLAKERKKLNRKGPRSRELKVPTSVVYAQRDSMLSSENVLGYVEGSDLKEELVVITAHYDHVGIIDGKTYNGADDDGSGTVALLEVAEAFAMAKDAGHGPRRSVLLMAVSGEEKGLLGSEFYSDNPIFPLEKTIADLNIDMVGRHDKDHQDGTPYVYVIGSDRLSSDLHRINEEVNSKYTGLELDYTFNAPDDPNRFYYRSDHYNFAKKGIPVIFYFSGVHDDYHQPGDDVEKIEFDLLEKRARLVFHTAWELANRDERIVVDGKVE